MSDATLPAASSTLEALRRAEPLLWINPQRRRPAPATTLPPAMAEAHARLARCAPLMAQVFPALAAAQGHVASPLQAVAALQASFGGAQGQWWLKRDDALPVAGSIKARGGFQEVLALAETLALEAGLIGPDDDRLQLATPQARALFAQHTVVVGSTGNLGMSIGLISRGLGFRAVVHMSADAKAWKKACLRDAGVDVIEHSGDYASAVAAGRQLAEADPRSYFVDDEHSAALFFGYAAAARELQQQLAQAGRPVNADHPLFVYLPCGVGGAPGGIAFGLTQVFGEHVHCFFAEPVAAPCMLVQLLHGVQHPVSVYDYGLSNQTEADGLAVAQASPLVAPLMAPLLAGIFTVRDDMLFQDLDALYRHEDIRIEPSAAAGVRGPLWLTDSTAGRQYLAENGLSEHMHGATHVIWSTGGARVPPAEYAQWLARAQALPPH